jgi:quercetin dioxygenase-like cupin family protein
MPDRVFKVLTAFTNKETYMRHTAGLVGVTLAVGIAAGVIGTQALNAQQESVKATMLLGTDLAGLGEKEGQVFLAEQAPGTASGKHSHPGHEFVYLLEGSAILEEEGRPAVTLKQGETVYQAPGRVHNAKNASTRAPLKVLVFLIAERGQPFIIPAK